MATVCATGWPMSWHTVPAAPTRSCCVMRIEPPPIRSHCARSRNLAPAPRAGRERRDEALIKGRAFVLAVAPWTSTGAARDAYPIRSRSGAVAGAHGIPEDATAAAYLQAFATNLISAAVRLVPLGQTAGLRVLAALEPVILRTADETTTATLDDLGGCAFRSDLAAMRHETQYTRLFRS